MTTLDPTMTLAELATDRPGASRVFHRLGLDFCCGGKRPLSDVCAERGLDVAGILAEIESAQPESNPVRWAERPVSDIVEFIVNHYHARLREELPELVELARRVETRHADRATCPKGLADHLEAVHASVLDHLHKEEQILFPLILRGESEYVGGPIHVMVLEHDDHGRNLEIIRELTNGLTPPEEACTSWRALYLRLDALEAELMEHIHLENHVLFPRATEA